MERKEKILLIIIISLFSQISTGQTSLPAFFSNNMVLQQNEKVPVWGMDDPQTIITVSGSWGVKVKTKTNDDGSWRLSIQTPVAGGPYSVTIKGSEQIVLKNIMIGEVWICSGQSNMSMPLKGYKNQPVLGSNEEILSSKNNNIRVFKVMKYPSLVPLNDVNGQWEISGQATSGSFSAISYFFAKKLNTILDVPIGLIVTSWGGSKIEAWMDRESLSKFDNVKFLTTLNGIKIPQYEPLTLYNGMLNPLIGYGIKGFVWYQGESNHKQAEAYKGMFPAMINLWRDKWGKPDIPFYFTQIAPFNYNDSLSAFLREAQLQTMQTVKNTGMAVILDIGECDCIHAANKKTAGNRLAYWALANTYGIPGIAYSGPVYKKMVKKEDGKLILYFDYAPNGLNSFGKKLDGFIVAGKNHVFYPATAEINKEGSLTIWSEQVVDPVAVRYAFTDCPQATLFNTEGLPASSFRTDDWEK